MVDRTPFEDSAWAALGVLEAAVAEGRPPAPNPALRPALARVEALVQQMPADVDPQLRHFLQRGSFVKARFWLEGNRE